jgi:hypothetical protein
MPQIDRSCFRDLAPGTFRRIKSSKNSAAGVNGSPARRTVTIDGAGRISLRENVVAGTDCGLGGRVHSELTWAKLAALTEGAQLANRERWK